MHNGTGREPLIPQPSLQGRRPFVSRREVVNAIVYVLRSGCPWRLLPYEFPAWQTVYYNFRRWEREGVWDRILHALRMRMRTRQGRDPEPSAAIIDSQSIKTSAVRGPEKGYDAGKKSVGSQTTRARRYPRQSVGACWVTGAEKSDHQGGRALLTPLKKQFPSLKLVWGDSHYGGTFLVWVKDQLGWVVQTVHALTLPKRGLLVPEGEEVNWETLFPTGFRPQPKRWIIERCFSQDSCAGVGCVAITRACRKAVRRSSSSRRAIACSPPLCQPSHHDRFQTLSQIVS